MFLELYGRNVAGGIVPMLWVVKHLDVIEDIDPSVLLGEFNLTENAFALEKLEEALGHCVVMAISSPTHTADQIVIAQKGLPGMYSEWHLDLNALVPILGLVGAIAPASLAVAAKATLQRCSIHQIDTRMKLSVYQTNNVT